MRLTLAVAILAIAAAALPAARKSKPTRPAAAKRAKDTERQVALKWLRSLSPRERIAQLIMLPFYGDSPNARSREYRNFVRWVRDLRVGGLIVLNRVQNGGLRNAEPHTMAAFLNRMQRLSRIPLIVGGDFERGASMRMTQTPRFPHNMAFAAAGDLEATRQLGAATAREARAMGVHWIYAPVADVNNNPDNPIINIRSFGEDPQKVARHVAAFLEGAQSNPAYRVITTAKHFPGHGDTSVDSHLGMPTLSVDRARLDEVELAPFRAAIAHGVDSIMTAHINVPVLDAQEEPATVSAPILTKLLRQEMKFEGLIVTDAMDMQGLARQFAPGEAAVRALEAGVDMLLLPARPDDVIQSVLGAMKQGRLSRQRIDESALKVLMAKVRVGLNKNRLVKIEDLSDDIDMPETEDLAQSVADRAVTLVRNEGHLLPVTRPEQACLLVLAESRYSQGGRKLLERIQQRAPKMWTRLVDPSLPDAEFDVIVEQTAGCAVKVVAAMVSVASYRGDLALAGGLPRFVNRLIEGGRPVALIALGSPYLLRSFPQVAAYMTTFSTAVTSEIAAAKALLGEIPIGGHMPVSIPGFARVGDGLMLPAIAAAAAP